MNITQYWSKIFLEYYNKRISPEELINILLFDKLTSTQRELEDMQISYYEELSKMEDK